MQEVIVNFFISKKNFPKHLKFGFKSVTIYMSHYA